MDVKFPSIVAPPSWRCSTRPTGRHHDSRQLTDLGARQFFAAFGGRMGRGERYAPACCAPC